MLVIQPWDRSALRSIEKAIQVSDLGLNPMSDGQIIRITIPPLSEERRQEMIKIVKRRVEERRIIIRNLRREAMDELKQKEKNKDISQDEQKRASSQLQKITDSCITDVEQIGRDKEAELMQV
jgi:ribosome recycling factor